LIEADGKKPTLTRPIDRPALEIDVSKQHITGSLVDRWIRWSQTSPTVATAARMRDPNADKRRVKMVPQLDTLGSQSVQLRSAKTASRLAKPCPRPSTCAVLIRTRPVCTACTFMGDGLIYPQSRRRNSTKCNLYPITLLLRQLSVGKFVRVL